MRDDVAVLDVAAELSALGHCVDAGDGRDEVLVGHAGLGNLKIF